MGIEPTTILSLRRDSPPKSSPTFSVRPRSSVGRVTVDLIRRSWVRFPPRSKDFFFTSCGSLIPFTRANAQWVIHGLNWALKFTLQSQFSVSPLVWELLSTTTDDWYRYWYRYRELTKINLLPLLDFEQPLLFDFKSFSVERDAKARAWGKLVLRGLAKTRAAVLPFAPSSKLISCDDLVAWKQA